MAVAGQKAGLLPVARKDIGEPIPPPAIPTQWLHMESEVDRDGDVMGCSIFCYCARASKHSYCLLHRSRSAWCRLVRAFMMWLSGVASMVVSESSSNPWFQHHCYTQIFVGKMRKWRQLYVTQHALPASLTHLLSIQPFTPSSQLSIPLPLHQANAQLHLLHKDSLLQETPSLNVK